MKELAPILIGVFIAAVALAVLWRRGAFLKVSGYVDETKEELRKCSWPSKEELWGSTQVVIIAVFAIGLFTVVVDFIFTQLIQALI
jgi:preprotein translocase subunit SecE